MLPTIIKVTRFHRLRYNETQHGLALAWCVGFGVSKPEHVRMLRDAVDGVIVGSALVRPLEGAEKRPAAEVVREVGELAATLVGALSSG